MDGEAKDWDKYQELVLSELKRHSESIEGVRKDLGSIKTDIAKLNVKSGIWGAAGGLGAGGLIGVIIKFVTGGSV
jgi:hypothetical protein